MIRIPRLKIFEKNVKNDANLRFYTDQKHLALKMHHLKIRKICFWKIHEYRENGHDAD